MALWTSTDVTTLCPELLTTPVIAPATFAYFIAIADKQVDPEVFGDRTVEAGAYLTAHLMLRAGYGLNATGAGGAGAAAGPITSITVGKVSVGYAGLAAGGAGLSAAMQEWLTTRPGSQFATLVSISGSSPLLLDADVYTSGFL